MSKTYSQLVKGDRYVPSGDSQEFEVLSDPVTSQHLLYGHARTHVQFDVRITYGGKSRFSTGGGHAGQSVGRVVHNAAEVSA
ncbi:MAG: hypothetical protein DRH08_06605 [Deltaproteobacteria bacterium]|nr:MAG: hypothetical protein DRH08_06605 [Deltaproteobacteria bacterium]